MRTKATRWKEIEDTIVDQEKTATLITPQNTLMMQGFEWHVPADQRHWQRLRKALPSLRDAGVDYLWIPPGCKGMEPHGTGYDLYDLYDIGEFHQKGSRATRWGSKEDLQALVRRAKDIGIGILWDTVLNHKAGADSVERFPALMVEPEDRNVEISEPETIAGWVGFNFPGRAGKYSAMGYHHQHFNGVDWDNLRQRQAIYKISGPGKQWATDVSDEHGNYDYLMFANLDHNNSEVRADIFHWLEWIGTELPISGMRIDAAKHYSAAFQRDCVDHLRNTVGANYLLVSLFDVPLLGQFALASQTERSDLRKIFRGTLVEQSPKHAVTFVGNHDTQPGQSLETIIVPFFKPIAYALILLRTQGQPCIFYGDLYGIRSGPSLVLSPSCQGKLPVLMRARKHYAYGDQCDYFDKRNCIGFVRYGNIFRPSGLACVISNAGATYKRMYVGAKHRGEEWTDILEWSAGTVVIDSRGYGIFPVGAKSVSVWVNSQAKGREHLQRPFDRDIYRL